MFDKFVNKLQIKKNSVILLTENSKTLLEFLKRQKGASKYRIDELFNKFLDVLLDSIGPKGTLLIQTFDWGFCKNKTFDIRSNYSRTSFLGSVALKRKEFIRTQHPIYSFAVTGQLKNKLGALSNVGAFDANSPFSLIYEIKAEMIIIDIPIHGSFTFAHFVEEMEGVNYRYNKSFTSHYINYDGIKKKKTYKMFVRDLKNNVMVAMQPLEKIFLKSKTMKILIVDNITIRKVNLFKAYDLIVNDIRTNRARSLYKIVK